MEISIMKRRIRNIGLVAALLTAATLPGTALAEPHDGQWHIDGELYLWGAGADITMASGQDVEVDFDEVLSDLELAFMGVLGARKDRWSVFGDVMFIGVDASETVPVTIPPNTTPIDAVVSIEQDAWIVTIGGGYELKSTSNSNIDFLGAIRYFDLSTDLKVDLGGKNVGTLHDSSDVTDVVVGIKGRAGLGHSWILGYYADVGAGGSDLTYQALIDINYQFNKVALGVGYRFLKWELDGKGALDDFQVSGPFAGILYRFK